VGRVWEKRVFIWTKDFTVGVLRRVFVVERGFAWIRMAEGDWGVLKTISATIGIEVDMPLSCHNPRN
jgi:hypothetical protein